MKASSTTAAHTPDETTPTTPLPTTRRAGTNSPKPRRSHDGKQNPASEMTTHTSNPASPDDPQALTADYERFLETAEAAGMVIHSLGDIAEIRPGRRCPGGHLLKSENEVTSDHVWVITGWESSRKLFSAWGFLGVQTF